MATDQRHPSFPIPSPPFSRFHGAFTPAANGSYDPSNYHAPPHPPTPLPLSSAAQSPGLRQVPGPVPAPAPAPAPPSNGSYPLVPASPFHPPTLEKSTSTSTYYDPTADYRESNSPWAPADYAGRSPVRRPSHVRETLFPHRPRVHGREETLAASLASPDDADVARGKQSRDYHTYHADASSEMSAYERHRLSPGTAHLRHHSPPYLPTSHSHPSSRVGSISQSPIKPVRESSVIYHDHDRSPVEPALNALNSPLKTSLDHEQQQPQQPPPQKPERTSNPMAFSSILSSAQPEPKPSRSSARSPPIVKDPRKPSKTSVGQALPASEHGSGAASNASSRLPPPPNHVPRSAKSRSGADGVPSASTKARGAKNKPATSDTTLTSLTSTKPAHSIATVVDDPTLDHLDPAEADREKQKFKERLKQRLVQIANAEAKKRKRRRTTFTDHLAAQLGRHADAGAERFRSRFAAEVITEVQQKEIQDEKERKKDMQRKRRREKTVQNEVQKRNEAMERAQHAADAAEREKFVKEAQRAEKKAKATKMILQQGDDAKELREVTPLPPNLDGGLMSSFPTAVEAEPEPAKKRPSRGGARPRKSKEQKQAEKDAAEAAHAAMENNEPMPIASKEERRETVKKEVKETMEASPARVEPFVSKTYHQLYDQIWRDIARKDIPKAHRIKESSLNTKHANLRKTAQLACKEARRWQLRTNKSMKDVQSRGKRGSREIMSFWKRNEREERDHRRMAEKQELENAKKAEADREANRQKRKLNFLISQTELYSHFIGRKIKTDEVERSTDNADVAASEKALQADQPNVSTTTTTTAPLPLDVAGRDATAKVTDFESLDFDDEDESKLQAIAAANAQNAIQEAQDRARAFNQGGEEKDLKDANFDEGELNFQNPTSLGDMTVEQPKMLTAQLKEYQLKGLNWLVNLYEQGINGILADEMGLGKTVQSISVMAYLAENHNIWGPFLVIAPASTLHNWQQEITRFVPNLKVLPYWGNAKDRKVLRKFWDRKHITYTRDSPFHVLVTSYQLVVQDAQYFQKIRWQYMILDEAQAIKSSQSSRWKSLLGFQCRNRLLLTGTPIQNNMQELWALLHFIMPSLFDSHDEFSDWFSKDIESHAQSNTKLNEDQLKRLHMILKPFMLRRVKKHVQKELGDKIEEDVFCDLTYRQRAYYGNLRNRISIMDLIEKAAVGDDQDTATLMNLVMQFRKVCNHPDLFERAETTSPLSTAYFAETASFLREGSFVHVGYSTRSLIEYRVPRLVYRDSGRVDLPGRDNPQAGFRGRYLDHLMNVWSPDNVKQSAEQDGAFSWLRFCDTSANEVSAAFHKNLFNRAIDLRTSRGKSGRLNVIYDGDDDATFSPTTSMLHIVDRNDRAAVAKATNEGYIRDLLSLSERLLESGGIKGIEKCARPAASAPPVELVCSSRGAEIEKQNAFFTVSVRKVLYGMSEAEERRLLDERVDPVFFPPRRLLPMPSSEKARFTNIWVPSMRRFVTDSGKLARLDRLLQELKEGGHRVLLYFQMTRMIDLMEEYLTYRNYKYLRLDGSTKLEDRRDTVHDFQTRPEVFVFLLSTRAGGLGINLTAADTVIFYDSDWNPTIDSQAMDRAHRVGQTRQVTVYRLITRGTIEERIRKRALQKEEVQRVVISGGSGAGVDFNTRSRENRTKDIALWLADDDQAAEIERKEAEIAAVEAKEGPSGKKQRATKKQQRKADVSLDDMYHEGEGDFEDGSGKPSGTATPVSTADVGPARGKKGATSLKRPSSGGGGGVSKRARTAKERLRMADGEGEFGI